MASPRRPRNRYGRGRPPATVIGHTVDEFGDQWAVRERRPTPHGFAVELGWPVDRVPGPGNKGVGAPKVILTPALAQYLRQHPAWGDIDLPISGKTVLARFLKALNLDYRTRRAQWWEEHREELQQMGDEAFALKHGLSIVATQQKRARLLGPKQQSRPAGWWRQPVAAKALLTQPVPESARQFELSEATINHWRRKLLRDCPVTTRVRRSS